MTSYPKYSIKAFRENGTPTVNSARHFDDIELARTEAKSIANAMGRGYVQLSKYDSRPEFGFYTVIEHFEANGPKIGRR
jgi:hypothetical protein